MNTHIGDKMFGGNTVWPSCTTGFGAVGTMTCDYRQEFHSYRVGGCQFLFVDGHIQFLSKDLDHKAFSGLLSFRGQEIVNDY